MTAVNFMPALAIELAYEQGFVNRSDDPGGPTNLGITLRTLQAYLGKPCTVDDVKALTRATVTPIYQRVYWPAVNGDQLPSGVDLMMFDCAVNQGQGLAPKLLQNAVGVAADGVIGPQTLSAVAVQDPVVLIAKLRTLRLKSYKADKNWPIDGNGWLRRLNGVAATATAWATKASKAS